MAKKKYAIGVDMGASFTKMGLVDNDGNLLTSATLTTTAYKTVQDFVAELCMQIQLFAAAAPDEVVGVGLGAPNANFLTGAIDNSANQDRKSTRLNSSHVKISYAVF